MHAALVHQLHCAVCVYVWGDKRKAGGEGRREGEEGEGEGIGGRADRRERGYRRKGGGGTCIE